MEEKSRYYKDMFQLDKENELQTLFSPYCYVHEKRRYDLGTGVGFFKSLSDALKHDEYPEIYEPCYGVMEVEVPKDKYLYDAEKPLADQDDYIKNCLFDSYALQILFQFEFKKLNDELGKQIKEENITDTKTFLDKNFSDFYEKKKAILLEIKDGKELIDFVAAQTAKNDKDIASAYISWAGIYGIKTTNPEYPFEYLIFNFKEHCNITGAKEFESKETNETTVQCYNKIQTI